MSNPKNPVVFDVEKIKDLMTEDGYAKFLEILHDIGNSKENTLLVYEGKPVSVFIPAWKVAKAVEGLALE